MQVLSTSLLPCSILLTFNAISRTIARVPNPQPVKNVRVYLIHTKCQKSVVE
jgi:hypothetical protein